jgi:hypothetical protein
LKTPDKSASARLKRLLAMNTSGLSIEGWSRGVRCTAGI